MAKNKPPSKHSRAARRATSPSINTDKSLKAVSLPSNTVTTSSLSSSGAGATTPTADNNNNNNNSSNSSSIRNKDRPSVLAVHRAAGVSKKTSRPARKSRLTAKMRRRRERGLEMAEAVTERTGLKIEKSIGRARGVQARARGWDDVNARAGEAVASSARNAFAALGGDDDDKGEDGEGDDQEEEEKEDGKGGWETDDSMDGDVGPVSVPAGMRSSMFAPGVKADVAAAAPAAGGGDDDEEIL
ncbi:hypothetical protein JDV02_005670 [Purpureocillium takamizusanense]|uniref:Alb1-domain-containing protein n=1 Tax=Purpureocillium takamizusanense TaxID=2060973 RepID=A0A9Q8VBA8_9HYPO|nr:uncharacterized protein JDV02_005670 [Purpureocillium takamizusanense]UNI19488.1 hypothetical protein JDV02_005670 [Purpureocillium takamizusanense]